MPDQVIVLKFGSSVLRSSADLPNAVHEIYRWYRDGVRVVAVVSAIGEATDRLLAEARELSALPDPYATAELLATGERASAALLCLALDRSGVPARMVDPREIGLTAEGSALDSEPLAVNVGRLRALLSEVPVLVVPGFIGTDPTGRTRLLGRGGSDLSAVFLAQALSARRCRLIKDVDGVYERDPALEEGAPPRRFGALDYADALKVAAPLIQPKAVSFLRQYWARAEVAACASGYETTVHAGATQLGVSVRCEPSRVLLLGLGTVGFGVYQRLLANGEHFEVIGALVREPARYEAQHVPQKLLYTDIDRVCESRPDIVVDALSGLEPSAWLVEHFLSTGTPVVSANKALLAEAGVSLAALAMRRGSTFRYSAAVGGAAPMIEAVDRCAAHAPVVSIAAVLNGTCNFVLDRCAEGASLEDALAEARQKGFAEADSREDLSGRDASRKLRILSRHAFGREAEAVDLEALDERVARLAQNMTWARMRLRQVARAARCDGEVQATVRFEEVPRESPFGRLRGEWNALQILSQDGDLRFVTGRGAGRWPTTEAVTADVFDAHRARTRQNQA